MNFIFVLYVISLFWRSNNCGLVTNLLGTVTNDVDKISKGEVVETLSEETTGIADDLGNLLSLGKSTELPKSNPKNMNKSKDKQANSHELMNKKDLPKQTDDGHKTTQSVQESEDHKNEINKISTLIDEGVSTETDASNDPFETTSENDIALRSIFVAGCLEGYKVADDGSCQKVISD